MSSEYLNADGRIPTLYIHGNASEVFIVQLTGYFDAWQNIFVTGQSHFSPQRARTRRVSGPEDVTTTILVKSKNIAMEPWNGTTWILLLAHTRLG